MKESWTQTVERYLAEGRTVSGGKGQDVAKEQLQLQNSLQQQSLALEQEKLAKVSSAMAPYLTTEGQGYTEQQLTAMRTMLLGQISTGYNTAARNTMTQLARHGSVQSGQPVGGDFTRGIASLQGAAASDRASGLTNIELQNAQQSTVNRFNAGNLISGNAATLANNVNTFGSGANSALSSYISAVNAPGWMSGIGQLAGQVGGQAMKTFGCWIAREVYGDDDPRWFMFRETFFQHSGFWQGIYCTFGEPIAKLVNRWPWLKRQLRKRMDSVIAGGR